MQIRWVALLALLVGCGDKDTVDTATEDTGDTETTDSDGDGDGVPEELDCDDTDATVYPAAPELCDGLDNNCDEVVDEGFDNDGDGFRTCDDDCDDNNAAVYPGSKEIAYDNVDQDCDGSDLNDIDGDGFAGNDDDCNDNDAAVFPGNTEVAYDGIDQDCDGDDLTDVDGDGFDSDKVGGEDCDDNDDEAFPGNTSVDLRGDGRDINCDGEDGATYDLEDAPVSIVGETTSLTGRYLAACDLDDDSLTDLVVSAPFGANTSGDIYAGRVGVFYGASVGAWTADMAMSDADVLIEGEGGVYSQFFGFGIACEDFDGDGVDDLAIGRGEINYAGAYVSEYGVSFFYGGALAASLYDSDADAVLEYPLDVIADTATVREIAMWSGDTDGDGMSELLLRMSQGTFDTTLKRYDQQNADGNLWVVSPGSLTGTGDLQDYATYLIEPDSQDALLDVLVTDSLSGDGDPDMLLGQASYFDESTEMYPGLLNFLGAPGDGLTADLEYASYIGPDDDGLGFRSVVGDFDGDGLTDLITSAVDGSDKTVTEGGRLYLVSDISTALTDSGLDPDTDAAATVLGQSDYASLGAELDVTMDIDLDGTDDVLVMESGGGSVSAGRVMLVGGGTMKGTDIDPDELALLIWENLNTDRILVEQVVGDFDGDGADDFVVSSYVNDSADYSGEVYIYLSTDIGLGI